MMRTKVIVKERPIHEQLLSALRSHTFTKPSGIFQHKIATGSGEYETFGRIHRQFNKYIGDSIATEKYPQLWSLIKKYALSLNLDFMWTTCSVSKNNKCKPHYDTKNIGLTMIVAIGDYTGGRLMTDTDGAIDIRTPHFFNGNNILHWTEDFEGERYSLMFYNYGMRAILRPNTTDAKCLKEIKRNIYGIRFKPEQRWCDIGANVGLFSMFARMHGCYTKGYEPDPDNCAIAAQNSPNIVCAAVTVDGLPTKLYKGKSAWNYTTYRPVKGRDAIIVNGVTFADAIRGCNAVKMDIEGEEIRVLWEDNDLSEIETFVFAYHINYAPSRAGFLDLIQHLSKWFSVIEHQKLPDSPIMDFFPNEIIVKCYK
jgi:FkbM family methyltransferase